MSQNVKRARPCRQESGVRSQESQERSSEFRISFFDFRFSAPSGVRRTSRNGVIPNGAQRPTVLRLTTVHENAHCGLECGSSSYRLLMFSNPDTPTLEVRKPARSLSYILRCRIHSKGGSCCCRTPRHLASYPPLEAGRGGGGTTAIGTLANATRSFAGSSTFTCKV